MFEGRIAGSHIHPWKTESKPNTKRITQWREGVWTYCRAGALCLPPSNPGGNTVYVAFAPAPPINPRFSARVPAVPACEEVWNPGSRAQHSSVEWLFWALMTVMLRVLAEVGIKRKERERERERRRGIRCMV